MFILFLSSDGDPRPARPRIVCSVLGSYLQRICERLFEYPLLCRLSPETVRRAEVVSPGDIYEFRRQLKRAALEETNICDAIQQVSRLAGFHLAMLDHVVVQEVV
jgi:hypothetical protein